MSSLQLLDDVAALLSAASTTKDPHARVVFLAEARIRVENAKRRAMSLDELTTAAEGEMARLAREATK